MPSGTYHDPDRKHLHIVCCDPDNDGNVLLVSITKYTNDLCDQTCILEPHEHTWLRYRSYVLYRKSEVVPAAALQAKINSGDVVERDDMNAQAFLRVVNGICNSAQTPRKIKKYFGCNQPAPQVDPAGEGEA